jgi:hypothetical protein
MNKPENRKLGRVQYWEGQMLRSSDFLDIQRIEAQRRWWHTRAMHQAFGVYQDMQASPDDSSGTLQAINVSAGVAYDCFGRELVLNYLARVLLPAAPSPEGMLTLVARYRGMECRNETDARAAVCCISGGRSSAGTVEFAWTTNERPSPSEGVPLGRLLYSGRMPSRFRAFVATPTHRPLARPRLGNGSTVPGNTAWQPWVYANLNSDGVPNPIELGVQTTVDTSAAGFTEIPQYFAWLEGSVWDAHSKQLVPTLLQSLDDVSINSFTFRLNLFQPPPGNVIFARRSAVAATVPSITLVQDSSSFFVFAQQQQLYVAWLGCQMPPKAKFVTQKTVLSSKVLQPEAVQRKP